MSQDMTLGKWIEMCKECRTEAGAAAQSETSTRCMAVWRLRPGRGDSGLGSGQRRAAMQLRDTAGRRCQGTHVELAVAVVIAAAAGAGLGATAGLGDAGGLVGIVVLPGFQRPVAAVVAAAVAEGIVDAHFMTATEQRGSPLAGARQGEKREAKCQTVTTAKKGKADSAS